ncbi:hypothetical protein ED733_002851 [Metarhizium rileyi]|uniref:Uncharacterized protein n=1 Tax=Metarhizium rileyi (strain RCEF 4871) TaxID=1649241 RepID=A0A5C6G2H6_METRR|nr:hypothetical protein ED733_002851 [Metarhizium rileyi]
MAPSLLEIWLEGCILYPSLGLILMQSTDTETHTLDPYFFDNTNCDHDYGTPHSGTFDSQGWNPGGQTRQARAEERNPESSALGSSSLPFSYTVVWKLQLRKGRMMTLTGDTVEDIDIPPVTFWDETLKSQLIDVVNEKVPVPQYKPDETKITVCTSKRAQRPFQKRFGALNIDWNVVENKLRSWSNQGSNLTVEVWFVYQEIQLDTTNKVGKTGRGATNRQLASRDRLITQQEAAGIRPVWKDVYAVFECSSVVCPNRGFSCWRDPSNKKHYKLDSDIMEKFVDYAEEGNKLEKHDGVPERLREIIYKHDEEATMRKQLKRKASDPLPTTIRICSHGLQDGTCTDPAVSSQRAIRSAGPARLKFPMPIDEAPKSYCDWLCCQVTNETWHAAYRLACQIAIDYGYDLNQMYKDQVVEAEMLATKGVLQGIAIQFVSRIKEWLDQISPE